MNQLNIIGRLTRDPITRQTSSGKQVLHLTVAVDRDKPKDGEPTSDYFNVSVFNPSRIEYATKYMKKGYLVFVTGPVSDNTYTDKNGDIKSQMSIVANRVDNLTTRSEGEEIERRSGESRNAPPSPNPGTESLPWDDDDTFGI